MITTPYSTLHRDGSSMVGRVGLESPYHPHAMKPPLSPSIFAGDEGRRRRGGRKKGSKKIGEEMRGRTKPPFKSKDASATGVAWNEFAEQPQFTRFFT